jgi:DNA repair protein SbcD/Mre11
MPKEEVAVKKPHLRAGLFVSVRIAHLADLHLGYRAYHRVTPRGINVREDDVARAFRHAVARVIELQPDLVLVAGDVFHTVRPSNTAIAEAFRQFSVLTERLPGVPVVMIAGNHDSPRSADTGNILTLFREIENVIVVCEECRPVKLPQLHTTILCLPHVSLAAEHETAMDPDPSARHNLLMLHGEVQGPGGVEKLRYRTEYGGAVVEDTAIRPERWDYVALGHHHLYEHLAPNMIYPGGIERTSAHIWIEREPKGFLVYDTETGVTEFEEVETRPILDLRWIEAGGMSAAEIDDAILASVEGIDDGIRGKIVRLVVQDVPRHLARELNHRRIREWKAEALHFHLDVRPPEVRRRAGSGAPVKRQTLREQVEAFLRSWNPGQEGIERERLVAMGTGYIDAAGEG